MTYHEKTGKISVTQITQSEVRVADVDMQSPWKFIIFIKLNYYMETQGTASKFMFSGESLLLYENNISLSPQGRKEI